jgi:hypothetical protein
MPTYSDPTMPEHSDPTMPTYSNPTMPEYSPYYSILHFSDRGVNNLVFGGE